MTLSDKKGNKRNQTGSSTTSMNPLRTLKRTCFPVVGIGASSGGLQAIEALIANIPEHCGMAYVIISHLDPNHESVLPGLLKEHTSLPVLSITEGMKVSVDSIYVIPPNKNVTIKNGILHLIQQDEPHFSNMPIDTFLKSLALDRGENAVAVILSGFGSDGSLGARDINLYGGIVVAQDPYVAAHDSMPSSVINTGIVDLILSPEIIPSSLAKWLSHGIDRTNQVSECMSTIFSLMRSHTKHDFSSYKLSTIYRRVEKQMLMHHFNSLPEYVQYLQENPEEVKELATDILIGVTRFFRDADAFETLKSDIIPELIRNKPSGYCIRIWIPGCSTGEEVYSIAILFAEILATQKNHYSVRIFGTDIDPKSLAIARSGIYTRIIEEDVSKDRLLAFFTKEKDSYKIKKDIRNMIIFGEQNVICDPPFTKVDMISCRNLLIYMNTRLQKKILPIFHYSLRQDGMLFLGKSESVSGYDNLFEPVNRRMKIFRKLNTASSSFRLINHYEFQSHVNRPIIHTPLITHKSEESKHKMSASKIIENMFSPVCMLVNRNGNIEYIHGETDRFIALPRRKKNLNISDMEDDDVKKILTTSISSSFSQQRDIEYHNIRNQQGNGIRSFYIRIIYLTEAYPQTDLVLVIFEEGPSAGTSSEPDNIEFPSSHDESKELIIAHLKSELRNTKETLQATIEELESGNEELQSMNEELQSTNEEIETSKEELNSLNEELVILNTELQERIDLLTSVHDDMANLFNSTDIAIFFLDNNLCIKRFTPKAQEFTHLIQSDIGRPFSHFSTTLKYEKLMEDAEEVLRTLSKKSIEVQNSDDRWFNLRIMPYRTLANVIDGVVITLSDVSYQKYAESRLQSLDKELEDLSTFSNNIIDAMILPVILLSEDLEIRFANRAFYAKFMRLPDDILNKTVYEIDIFAELDLKKLIMSEFSGKKTPATFEVETGFSFADFKMLKIIVTQISNLRDNANSYMLTLVPQ